ncbi:sulfatase family protein [Nitrosopumilus sp.]|uniref:sulfatase family protein n=1 Tax=Nitrosopumilus sp. TaxID=2024843 RepID=UPI003D14A7E8
MQPNILLIVLDSLRADKLFGKNKTTKTPTIDSMIKNGIYFSNAHTTNQYTSQVMQSIFSGRFLLNDEFTKNYSFEHSFLFQLEKLGYHNYTLNKKDVFLQGLREKFSDDDISFNDEENIYTGLEERILKKISKIKKPWFYYIHLQDLHTPCVVPENLSHLNLKDRYDQNINQIDLLIKKILQEINIDETLVIITSDHGEYISPIEEAQKETPSTRTFVKNKFKNILPLQTREKIHKKKKILQSKFESIKTDSTHEKRTVLYNRRMLSKTLFDDITHVPLLFYGFKINPHLPINQQVCNVDIFPTIFELLEFSSNKNNFHGNSFASLLKNQKSDPAPIYLTSLPILEQLKANIKLESSDPVVGIRTPNFKYFRNFKNENQNVNLFDLQNDPFEQNNIAKSNPKVIEKMESYLRNFKISSKEDKIDKKPEKIDDSEIKKAKDVLKKLGYI